VFAFYPIRGFNFVKATSKKPLIILALLFLISCTEKKNPPAPPKQTLNSTVSPIYAIGDVKHKNPATGAIEDIVALQMMQKNGSLFVTGRPIAFAKWDITSNPEDPHPTFTASDNMGAFVPNQKWVPDLFAGSALGIVGNVAFMSGTMGMSLVDMSNTKNPVEIGRHPFQDPDSLVPFIQDAEGAFAYKAIIPNPTNPRILYGFREQDYVYTLNIDYQNKEIINGIKATYDNGPRVTIARKEAYGPNGVCCVTGGALFAGRAFVAFRSALWIFGISPNGSLGQPSVINSLQAYNVQATDRYVYIQHVPTGGTSAMNRSAGIYVFDKNGNQVTFLPVTPERFSVSPDDQYLFANVDNASVRIFRMTWAPR
jgi:hypothetical protein